jgi:hypothetical protein
LLEQNRVTGISKEKTELLPYCWITAGADESYAASQPLFTLFAVLCRRLLLEWCKRKILLAWLVVEGCCWSGV